MKLLSKSLIRIFKHSLSSIYRERFSSSVIPSGLAARYCRFPRSTHAYFRQVYARSLFSLFHHCCDQRQLVARDRVIICKDILLDCWLYTIELRTDLFADIPDLPVHQLAKISAKRRISTLLAGNHIILDWIYMIINRSKIRIFAFQPDLSSSHAFRLKCQITNRAFISLIKQCFFLQLLR